jgi:hypothetical protein
LWSQVSGPGSATFADTSSAKTTASFSTAGSYVLQFTATDTQDQLSSTATVTISVKSPPPDFFTFVILPDTQYYSAGLRGGTPSMFKTQTAWIAANQASRNIVYVVHLGDVTQHGDSVPGEWQNADAAMKTLDEADIPYGVAVGNHDHTPEDGTGGTVLFNQFFGLSRFSSRSYYGGHLGSDNNNHYDLFSAGGLDFIVVYLDWEASSDALDWANQLLQTYSNRRAIVVSHFILNGGTGAGFGSQGQAIFDALSGNPNLFLLLSGHVTPITQGRRQDTIDGHTIYSLMSDYQSLANGGNGWLRIMQFTPSDDEIQVSTYSPVLDQFQTSSVGQFSLSYNMHSQVARRAPGKHKTYTAHVVRPVARARRPSLDFRAQP